MENLSCCIIPVQRARQTYHNRGGEINLSPLASPKFTSLAPTSQQVDLSLIEFRALPGPEARALCAKTMRQHPFSGLGGQLVLSPRTGLFRCRGARPGARWARLILRKPDRLSGWISFPADAFCAQRPCFRATSLLFRKKARTKAKGGKFISRLTLRRRSIILHSNYRGKPCGRFS